MSANWGSQGRLWITCNQTLHLSLQHNWVIVTKRKVEIKTPSDYQDKIEDLLVKQQCCNFELLDCINAKISLQLTIIWINIQVGGVVWAEQAGNQISLSFQVDVLCFTLKYLHILHGLETSSTRPLAGVNCPAVFSLGHVPEFLQEGWQETLRNKFQSDLVRQMCYLWWDSVTWWPSAEVWSSGLLPAGQLRLPLICSIYTQEHNYQV